MNFPELADVAVSLHTALRKCCDSPATTVAWNLVYLLTNGDWVKVGGEVALALRDYTPPPVPATEETDWKLMRRIADEMAPLVRKHLLEEWQPFGQGHGLVALSSTFELFCEDDWREFVSYLPHLIPTT